MDLSRETSLNINMRTKKTEIPAGLWMKCASCDSVIYQTSLNANFQVCPSCGYYYPMTPAQRLCLLADTDSFKEFDSKMQSVDALNFGGDGGYKAKLAVNQAKTGSGDAILTGVCKLNGIKYALGIMDFRFMGASMGSVVGEKVTRLTEYATDHKLPLVIVTASGGARMQEGALSLMQMAKTSGALMLHKKKYPFITILTNPTTGGVTASFASLGDLILAEPHALIGFAGQRVIRQTTQSELPAGFQTSEYLLEHGFIDRIVERRRMRSDLAFLLQIFQK